MAMSLRTQTMVQLNDDLLKLLDSRASADGVSRSQIIRDAIEAYLADDRAIAVDQMIIEGYKRMPQGGEFDADEWGNLGTMMATMSAEQMRQLNDEEREAGFEPW
jgi:predicted transcriptional regulator